jgi:hypothetical protein
MYNKAIAALITPIIVGALAPLGIHGDTTVAQALEIILMAVSTAIVVYLIPNKV